MLRTLAVGIDSLVFSIVVARRTSSDSMTRTRSSEAQFCGWSMRTGRSVRARKKSLREVTTEEGPPRAGLGFIGFRVQTLGFRLQDLGLRLQRLGFGFKV